MGRDIIVNRQVRNQAPGDAPLQIPEVEHNEDKYASQIIKLIPVEIVGVYIGLQNQFSGHADLSHAIIQLLIFLVILLISPFYLKTVGGITDRRQRLVSILSYVIWGFSLGGPFEFLFEELGAPFTAKEIGGALILLYTLVVPMIYKKTG